MNKSRLAALIKEEVKSIKDDVDMVEIKKSLDELYNALKKEGAFTLATRNGNNKQPVFYKVLTLETVSRLTEVKVNHLMLYFIHTQNLAENADPKIQMQQRQVYFVKVDD